MTEPYDPNRAPPRAPLDVEHVPLTRSSRRSARIAGCLIALIALVGIVWFAVTHTGTTDRGYFGF